MHPACAHARVSIRASLRIQVNCLWGTLDTSLVRLLLPHGASTNALDLDMNTPLHVTISAGLHEIAGLPSQGGA